jgi:hypothetical protein
VHSSVLYIYTGNVEGEVYIYNIANFEAAFQDKSEDRPITTPLLNLVDIVLTQEPFVVRDCRKVDDFHFACCTEGNKV